MTADEARLIDAYWRAANYLSVGQIYLCGNPLLREPLTLAHVKPRLLGHWGTTPGLNFVYAHMNRAIYPSVSRDVAGLARLFTQFSFPGGIPSHAAPETPGSIHEGGELGYALAHAYGAAFDNPDLLVACVVGDGEAETGPLATSWHGNRFLNPRTDGAVLPILHLNGYKIANPTLLARIPEYELVSLFEGYGYRPILITGGFEGEPAEPVHRRLAAALDEALDDIERIQREARSEGPQNARSWPMLVLRTPKGWT